EAMKMLIKPYILYDIFNLDTEDLKSEIMTNYLELINRLKEKYTSHFTLLIEGREIESLREAVQKAVEDLKSNHQTIPLYEELYPYDKLYWRLVSMYAQETDFEKSYEILKEMDRLVIGILKFLDEFLVRILSNLAFIDPLTGLYNRNFMYNALRKEISMCRRYNLPMSFVVIDVDNFKNINDTYGHYIGDRVLSTLGSIIRHSIRFHDVPIRVGGEEFLIILPNTSEEGGFVIAERIRKKVEECKIDSITGFISFTISAGVSRLKDYEKPEESIKKADEAMYFAKNMGKNKVVVVGHEP
ncbi:MAG: GGDEF domain-containing protein, partial [Aquificaceae bacterium]|nr:GGDEF domain-containing protein [Aquificaceae bacterium]